jgi:hypothetical protein
VINSEGSFLRNPSPGPNVYAGLGPPGMAREDTPPLGSMPGTIPESSTPPGSAPPAEEGSPADPNFVYALRRWLILFWLRMLRWILLRSLRLSSIWRNCRAVRVGAWLPLLLLRRLRGPPLLAMSLGMDQGIGSLVPPPVIAPLQPPPMAGINPPASELPILYFGPDGRPVYGGIF